MILSLTIVCMAEPGTNQPGGGVTILVYHKLTFLQVLASNATNNTNTHHGNQSGKGRGYNFLQQKRRNTHLSCAKELLSSWSRRQQQPLVPELMGYNTLVCNVSDTIPRCQLFWTRCQKEPEFVIAKLNGGFVGPMQTKGFPASNVHQTGRTTRYVKSYMWAFQGHQRTSYLKRFPRDTREIWSPECQKQSKTQLRTCFINPFTFVWRSGLSSSRSGWRGPLNCALRRKSYENKCRFIWDEFWRERDCFCGKRFWLTWSTKTLVLLMTSSRDSVWLAGHPKPEFLNRGLESQHTRSNICWSYPLRWMQQLQVPWLLQPKGSTTSLSRKKPRKKLSRAGFIQRTTANRSALRTDSPCSKPTRWGWSTTSPSMGSTLLMAWGKSWGCNPSMNCALTWPTFWTIAMIRQLWS